MGASWPPTRKSGTWVTPRRVRGGSAHSGPHQPCSGATPSALPHRLQFRGLPLPARSGVRGCPRHPRMQKHHRGSRPGRGTRSSSEPPKTASLAAPPRCPPRGDREGRPPNAAGGPLLGEQSSTNTPHTPPPAAPPGYYRAPVISSRPPANQAGHSRPPRGRWRPGRGGKGRVPGAPPPALPGTGIRTRHPPGPGSARAASGPAPLEKRAAYAKQPGIQNLYIMQMNP